MPLVAAAHRTGTILPCVMPARSALSISASASEPSSRYLARRSSSVSAAASTSFSRHSFTVSASSVGMAASLALPSAKTVAFWVTRST